MLEIFIPLAVIGASITALLIIAFKKIPHLRTLDVLSLPETKFQELKRQIMAERLLRKGGRYVSVLKKIAWPFKTVATFGTKAAKGRIAALEAKYQKLKAESSGAHAIDREKVKKLLEEGKQLMREGRYGESEKRFIEILSHDPKNTDAYELLGDMYLARKSYDQAEETYTYILTMKPNDASVQTSLGEIELERGRPEVAKNYFAEAIAIRPNNPKYLDFYIEACIRSAALDDAKDGLERLKTVNPDNQKLAEFAARIIEMEQRLASAEPAEPEQEDAKTIE